MGDPFDNIRVSFPAFDGKEGTFGAWLFAFRAIAGKANLLAALDEGTLSAADGKRVYYVIATTVTGAAVPVARSVEEGDGQGAFRALLARHDPKSVFAQH